jgi:hypothetical protein
MGGKKKKGKKKGKKEKKEGDDEEEKHETPECFQVVLPEFGWIRVKFVLCDAPCEKFNFFYENMRSSDRVMEMKKRITDYHGRVENI